MTQIITIQDDECWKCGNTFNNKDKKRVKTSHHAIPKNLKPVKNLCVPLCEGCHREINKQDINSLKAFVYKLWKTSQSIPTAVKMLIDKLETLRAKGDISSIETPNPPALQKNYGNSTHKNNGKNIKNGGKMKK